MKSKLREKVKKLVKEDMFDAIQAEKETGWLCEPENIDKILSLIKKEILGGMPKEESVSQSYNYTIGFNHGIQRVRDYIKRL